MKLLLLLLLPWVELWLLIRVGAAIGALVTVLLVMLTAALGLAMMQQQGFRLAFRLDQQWQQGTVSGTELLEGPLLALGGLSLLFPGFITDGVGLFCLLPWTRRWLVRRLWRSMMPPPPDDGIIEAEYREVSPSRHGLSSDDDSAGRRAPRDRR